MRLFGFSALGALPLAAVTLFLGLMVPLCATGFIDEVAVAPPYPTKCDSTSFHVTGNFPSGCWHYDGYDLSILPTMGPFTAYLMQVFCHRDSGDACTTVIVPYDISHELGMLAPGAYSLMVVEVDSQDSTLFHDQKGISFSVSDACGPIEGCVMPGFAPPQNGCNAVVSPGNPGCLTVTLSNLMAIAGAEMVIEDFQQFRDWHCGSDTRCGFMTKVVRVEPVMRAFDMGVDWTFDGKTLHFMLYPYSSDPREAYGMPVIEPGEGPIARVWIEVELDNATSPVQIPQVSFDVVLVPVAFADEHGRSVPACPTFAPITGTVCIGPAAKCDVNGDGRRDVVDIVRMINCIMCPIPEGCCTPEETVRADCNGDGVLNVTDVVCCIRLILDSICQWCVEGQVQNPTALSESATIGLSGDVSWSSDNRLDVPLTFFSAAEVGGVEARIQYDPNVLSVAGVTLSEAFHDAEVFFSASDGDLSLMVVDVDGGALLPGSDLLGEISFVCTAWEGSETELVLEGAAVADVDGTRMDVVLSETNVPVSTPSAPAVHLTSRPNPFHSSADVTLYVRSEQKGLLTVYDVAGRLVRTLHDGILSPGPNAFSWDGKDNEGAQVRTGVYFLRFEGREEALTRKLVLLRR
jgi:hypothetical protein